MTEPYPEHETAEEAFAEAYQELSHVTARVLNKIIGLRNRNRAKTWADVGDLEHSIAVMHDLDEFLGV